MSKGKDKLNLSPSEFAFFILGLTLYPWQIEALEAICDGRKVSLCAANGSGKTACVIAAAILWFLYTYPKGRCPVISGSWQQVESQLFPALEVYKNHIFFKDWNWKHCQIETAEGGFCIGFSTNDENKMEGWHESPDAPTFYIADEAKAISDAKMSGIDRCTRTFTLITSSPGAPSGYFYDTFHKKSSLFYGITVTAFDCSHIKKETIEFKKRLWGENSPLYRSSVLGEFTHLDNCTILDDAVLSEVLKRQKNAPTWNDLKKSAALDFAAGGDEDVIAISDGKRAEIYAHWRERNTTQASRRIVRNIESLDIPARRVVGDADGLGLAMIHNIQDAGLMIREFHGGSTSNAPKNYYNLISEVWITGCRKIANGEIYISGDTSKLFEQLTNRHLEFSDNGRLRVEPKDAMKARGVSSPDQADALLMSIWLAGQKGGMWQEEESTSVGLEELGFEDLSCY